MEIVPRKSVFAENNGVDQHACNPFTKATSRNSRHNGSSVMSAVITGFFLEKGLGVPSLCDATTIRWIASLNSMGKEGAATINAWSFSSWFRTIAHFVFG